MSLDGILARGRAMAEAIQVDTCRISKPGTGNRVLNPETKRYEDPPRETVYEGSFRLRMPTALDREALGQADWTVQDRVGSLPVVESIDVAVGHVVEHLTCPNDPGMVGRVYGVVALHGQTHSTARRLKLREVTGSS